MRLFALGVVVGMLLVYVLGVSADGALDLIIVSLLVKH